MSKTRKWLLIGVALLAAGLVLEAIGAIVFLPGLVAYSYAAKAWLNSTSPHIPSTMPSPASFGLNQTNLIIYSVLSLSVSILIFLGSAFLIILLATKIFRRTEGLP